MQRPRQKIFCVGVSKTGTLSLVKALEILGFKSGHWDITKELFRYEDNRIKIDFGKIEPFDALADSPVARVYKELDRKYPEAKFILTIRETSSWEASFRRWFNESRKDIFDDFSRRLHKDLYGSEYYQPNINRTAYLNHNQSIASYFSNKPTKLLTLNVCGGEGWGPLCEFLELSTPKEAFPHEDHGF